MRPRPRQSENDLPHNADRFQRPILSGFDPLSPQQLRDPHVFLDRARVEQPVFFAEGYGFWCVTRYEDVRQVYRDTAAFANGETHGSTVPLPDEIREEIGGDYQFIPTLGALNDTDPPRHTRIRKALQPSFTPRAVKRHEPMIQALADELIDAFVDDRRCDVLSQFSAPLASGVIATLLGVSKADAAQFKSWADARFQLAGGSEWLTEQEILDCWRRMIAFDRYVERLVDDRRELPRDDLTSDIVHAKAEDGSPALSDDEALANVWGMVAAGSDTSAALIAHALYLLLRRPEEWRAVKGDPRAIPGAIEETMRYMGPVRGAFRRTTKDVSLGGVTIPEGEEVYIHLASAGRDAQAFTCPHRFDRQRANADDHLGFGIWAHFCLGAGLARTEARIALQAIAGRLPDLELVDPEPQDFLPSHLVVGLKHLHVTW